VNRALAGVVVISALLVVYLVFSANYAWILINDASPLVNAMGYALGVLPLVGAWALVAELLFARASAALMKQLEAEGGLPGDEFATKPSGRADRAQAQQVFENFADEVRTNPESWRAWLRLGLAYDASGDRRRARWAIRKAIELGRAKKP
jgi:cytochrome c-type biogenesis protein CcmH/NrfG